MNGRRSSVTQPDNAGILPFPGSLGSGIDASPQVIAKTDFIISGVSKRWC